MNINLLSLYKIPEEKTCQRELGGGGGIMYLEK